MRLIAIVFDMYGNKVLLNNNECTLRFADVSLDVLNNPVDIACDLVRKTFDGAVNVFDAFVVRTQMCAVQSGDGSIVDNLCTVAVLSNSNLSYEGYSYPGGFVWYSVNSGVIQTRMDCFDYAYLQEAYKAVIKQIPEVFEIPVIALSKDHKNVVMSHKNGEYALPVVKVKRNKDLYWAIRGLIGSPDLEERIIKDSLRATGDLSEAFMNVSVISPAPKQRVATVSTTLLENEEYEERGLAVCQLESAVRYLCGSPYGAMLNP